MRKAFVAGLAVTMLCAGALLVFLNTLTPNQIRTTPPMPVATQPLPPAAGDAVAATEPAATEPAATEPAATEPGTGEAAASGQPTGSAVPPANADPAAPAAGTGHAAEYTGGNAGSDAVAADVISRLNRERVARGYQPLTVDPLLTGHAVEWSQQMPAAGYVHSSEDRLRAILAEGSYGGIGENIHAPERQCGAAVACGDLAAQPTSGVLHVDWMHSAHHRTNMLDPRWSRVGVGVRCDANGRMWATMLLAGSKDEATLPALENSPEQPLAVPGNAGITCSGQERGENALWRPPTGVTQ